MRRGAGGELARRRRAAITSVFPSTTASAITTSYTGRTPLEHGLTGWFTYFGDAGCVAAALPFSSRGDKLPLSRRGVTPEQIYISASLFESLPVRSIVVTYGQIIDSDYNLRHCRGAERVAYETLDGLVAQVEARGEVRRASASSSTPTGRTTTRSRTATARESARGARRAGEDRRRVRRLLARLAGTDTLVIATADHGFIDCAPEESLELPAALASHAAASRCAASGAWRTATCTSERRFLHESAETGWASAPTCMPSRELVDEGWFGPGAPHPRFAERIGDVALVMRGRYTMKDWRRASRATCTSATTAARARTR